MKDNKSILLVEDEVLIALGKQQELEKYGYIVQHTNTGEKAVVIIKENKEIDLILMDIDLGKGIDGTEAAAIILKNHNIPIVFMSSHTDPEIVEKTEKITSYGYVVKSASITVLDASIKMAFKLFDANSKTEKHRQHLRTTLNSIGDAVITTDILGNVTDMNPVAENLTGWSFELAFGKPLSEVFHIINEGTHEKNDNPVKNVLETGKIMELANHTVLISKDGLEHQIADSAAPIKDSDGLITGVVLVFRDVTEQKVKENTIKAYQQRLALHINQTPLAVIDWDVDFNVISWNKSAEKIFGFSSEEALGRHAAGLIIPENAKKAVDAVWISLLDKTGGTRSTNENITKKGKIILCEWYNTAVVNDDGIVIGVSSLVMDITEQKLAAKQLEESEKRYRELYENSPLGYQSLDENGNFVEANLSLCNLLGYEHDEIIDKWFGDILTKDGVEIFRTNFPKFKEKGEIHSVPFDLVAKNGNIFSVEIDGSIGYDNNGHFKQTHCVIQDVSKQKKLTGEIKEQLNEKEMILKEVHHRIKNNFATIGNLLSLQMDSLTNPEAKTALEAAFGRVHSMQILYEKLLLTENYQTSSTLEYFENLIDDIIRILSGKIKISVKKQIDNFNLNSKLLITIGIIVNELLTNIMKYAFTGKDSGLIDISLTKDNGNITLTIEDDGIGLPEGLNIDKSNGFGLMLIKMLTEQLEGNFNMDNHMGTRSILKFHI